jgi:cobalt/nickel transport system ATP-binding protein
MCQPILEARDLYYTYDRNVSALCGLNLRVQRGRKLALVGSNGAGKSTLLLHFNGLLKPHLGQVFVNGHCMKYDRNSLSEIRTKIGLVFQDPDDQLFSASVYQDVSFGPLNLGLSEREVRSRVGEALESMRLTELCDRPTHMLSFGQKKRVAIAGVLAMQPDVLVFDEPTAGLDPAGLAELLFSLDLLHATGKTLIVATHDLDLAAEWPDEVAILSDGVVAQHGIPSVVLSDPDLMEAARLRVPRVFEFGLLLRKHGLIPELAPLPGTLKALIETLTMGR